LFMDAPFPKFFSPLAVACLLAFSTLQFAPGDDAARPPSPSIGKVVGSPQVVRGGACEIFLRGIVMPGDSVEFKIHKGPIHGTLEWVGSQGRDSALYIYRHGGNKGAESDRIDFKLKTGPNNTWGRVTAHIAIEEPASRVELASDQLDFGSVPIGQTRPSALLVRNGGGGILRGTLGAGAPWSIVGPAEFELAEGEAREFRVVFSPDGPGERQGRLDVVAAGGTQPVTLKGTGVYRFEAPKRVAFDAKVVAKKLEIPLTNRTNRELPLSIDLPSPLLGETSILLPPNGTAVLGLEVEKRHYTEKFAEVSISDGPAVRTVRVALPDPPALLEWAVAGGAVDLGEVAPRNIPRPEFELRNRGATAAKVQLRSGEGGLAPAPGQAEEFHLHPGESAVVKTVWRVSENPGEVSASLIAAHGGLDHPLTVKAIVAAPPVLAENREAAPSPVPTPPPVQVLTEQERNELVRRRPSDISYRLQPAGRLTDVVVTWKYEGPVPVQFSLEQKVVERSKADMGDVFERRLKVPEELPKPLSIVKWVPVTTRENPVRQLEDGTLESVVAGLEPGYHEVRIAARAPPDGKRIDYSEFVVRVFPPPPNPLWKWITGALGIFCLLYLLREKIRRILFRESREE